MLVYFLGQNDYILKSVFCSFALFTPEIISCFMEVGENDPIVSLTLINKNMELKEGALSFTSDCIYSTPKYSKMFYL